MPKLAPARRRLYTDYLQVPLGQVTATGLSKVMDNAVSHDSHDQVTRMLAQLNPG